MGTKYTTELVGGVVSTYADGSPADDGSQTNANLVKYATIISDLTAPLHSAIQGIDAKLVSLMSEGPTAIATDYTTVASDFASVLECSGTITISLLNPSGNAGYRTTIKNAGAGSVTVGVDGGALVDTATNITITAKQAATFMANAGGTAYYSIAAVGYTP